VDDHRRSRLASDGSVLGREEPALESESDEEDEEEEETMAAAAGGSKRWRREAAENQDQRSPDTM
jgi:hypothetical protein